MVNVRQTVQVGQKLLRTFGKGVDTKHIITKSRGGETVTRVLDYEGNLISQRVKSISKYSVGDKKVNEILKLKTSDLKVKPDLSSITNRVYSKDGKFLGSRFEAYREGKRIESTKLDAQGNGYNKNFYNYGEDHRVDRKFAVNNFKTVYNNLEFNAKGLPIPKKINPNDYSRRNQMSLQEMLESHLNNYGTTEDFYPKGLGYDKIEFDAGRLFDPVKYSTNINLWG